ncbi:MAG: hypothetical protein APR53_04595 [Methanoculleus sp. SDB]|nr:MAG: hypothetical protein APR53_04595 [Methanoculleus sp. SDB]
MKVILIVAMALMLIIAAPAAAKSMYVIGAINAANAPILSYNLNPDGTFTYQTTTNVDQHNLGPNGIAIDTDSGVLFITYESSSVIEIVDATTMVGLGQTAAPGASNLAGVVVDQSKQKVYTIQRSSNKFYVYTYDPVTKTLSLDGGTYKTLSGAAGWGLAVDETAGILYVANNNLVVKKYKTSDWSPAGDITLQYSAMGIALDLKNGYLYAGNAGAEHHRLIQYNLNTGTETSIIPDSSDEVVGLEVDPLTGILYITTGDMHTGTSPNLMAYDSSLTQIDTESATEGHFTRPTDLCIPGKDISYNPLNLVKADSPDPVLPGGTINYGISWENTNPTAVDNVVIVDTLPAEVDWVSGGVYDGVTHTVTWTIGTLTSGETGSAALVVTVKPATPVGTVITNFITIDSDQTAPTTKTCETLVKDAIPSPEFPTLAVPIASLIGLLGMIFLVKRK